jgi:hypothetical protein
VAALPLLAQDTQVLAEFDRIERELKQYPVSSPDFPNFSENTMRIMKDARDAVAAHRPFLALVQLSQLFDFTAGVRTAVDKAAIVHPGISAFDEEWSKVSRELDSANRELDRVDWQRSPAAVRALVELSRGRISPLMSGARGFATSTKPEDGLFYMGEAQGQLAFAKFCSTLKMEAGKKPRERSWLPELTALQEKANAAFVPPKSIDQHPRFIALNSTIKTARELDAIKSYTGALYQYLEATRIYAILEAPAPDEASLRPSLTKLRAGLKSSKEDTSLEQLFIERAEALLAIAKTPDQWQGVNAIANYVIPAYAASRKPAQIAKGASKKTVQLTLVRWPYT